MARKKQRETYGNGSITPKQDKSGKQMTDKQGNPLWLVCLSFGYEKVMGEDGKMKKRQRKVQRVAHGTLADARKFAKELNDQYEHVDVGESREKTFGDVCDAWEGSTRNAGKATESAMNGYVTNLGHMRKKIGKKPLATITSQQVEDALAEIREERGLGGTTMHKVYAITKRVFAYAVKNDWLVRNPCDKIEAPQIDEVVNRRSLTAEECALLRARIDAAEEKALADFEAKEQRAFKYGTKFGRKLVRGLSGLSCLMALRIELATGMRRSEVLGLTWSAIDFGTGQVTVRQKVIYEKKRGSKEAGRLVVDKPKTKTSIRTLFVDTDTLAHLKRWKEFQGKALHLVMPDGTAVTQTEETPVCVGDKGDWLSPQSILRWWEGYEQRGYTKGGADGTYSRMGFRDQIGFPGLCMHELRHTQATQLLGQRVDLKTVQARLGHAKASYTLDLYAHAIPANDRDAANIMGELTGAPVKSTADVVKFEKSA
ncbi:MAG: site-specific integrase [Eggerthellaceae bacterium]|nr:site-specific integrase [Eggerthellaceae bacterium]